MLSIKNRMIVTRFAPSPNGPLHLGHAYSAMVAHDLAKQAGGRFLLRIEDIDGPRSRPELADAFRRHLALLGLDWEEPVRRQSEHFEDYAAVLERLRAMGLVYRCFKTRSEILEDIARAPHGVGESTAPGNDDNRCARAPNQLEDGRKAHALG
mgnify:CR=1 FL=1